MLGDTEIQQLLLGMTVHDAAKQIRTQPHNAPPQQLDDKPPTKRSPATMTSMISPFKSLLQRRQAARQKPQDIYQRAQSLLDAVDAGACH